VGGTEPLEFRAADYLVQQSMPKGECWWEQRLNLETWMKSANWRLVWGSVALWIILMPRRTRFRCLNIVGELQMPAEVLSDRQELPLKYIWRH
jgi:hypothetical protein